MVRTSKASLESSAGGFTLIEVLVALVLLGVAVVMTVQLTTENQDTLAASTMQEQAVLLAREKMFALEQDELSSMSSRHGTFGREYPEYRWEATVHKLPIDEHYRLELTVRWGEKDEYYVCAEKIFKD
ncbi:MAG: prepilin-type N-terminal cleavage/methylation domain-containing protein [Desulfovibrionales bacterium]|nr:prepilin-type N-terminal cleavage/methylation domain-containing protein [Desulfovibrionales bacterium]